jgi:hypothetical protein
VGARFSAPLLTGSRPGRGRVSRKNRAIPLLPLLAFMASYRVNFTFTEIQFCFLCMGVKLDFLTVRRNID